MSRVLILVEGQTERSIIDQVFNPYFNSKGVFLFPRIVGKPGHKGGNRFEVVHREIVNLLRQESASYVTMLFDYYGLPGDWPELKSKPEIIESAISRQIAEQMGTSFNPARFIPYIQMHEVESLLFAGPKEMAEIFSSPSRTVEIQQIVNDCGGCELINDHPETAPSKRIMKMFPTYKKGASVNAHAYRIASRIGMEKIRQQCPRFSEWINTLERLNVAIGY